MRSSLSEVASLPNDVSVKKKKQQQKNIVLDKDFYEYFTNYKSELIISKSGLRLKFY